MSHPLPQSHLEESFYTLSRVGLGINYFMTFLTFCLLLWKPREKETWEINYRSHAVQAQVKTKKRNPTRLQQPFFQNSSSQTVFLGTLGLHRGIPWVKQVGSRLLTPSLTRAASLWSVCSLGAWWKKYKDICSYHFVLNIVLEILTRTIS